MHSGQNVFDGAGSQKDLILFGDLFPVSQALRFLVSDASVYL
jgi:hypothetical protein